MRIGIGDVVCDATGVCLDTSNVPVTSPPVLTPTVEQAALTNLPVASAGTTAAETAINVAPVLSASQAAALPQCPAGQAWDGSECAPGICLGATCFTTTQVLLTVGGLAAFLILLLVVRK